MNDAASHTRAPMIGAPQTLAQVIKERLVKQCDIAATNLVAKYPSTNFRALAVMDIGGWLRGLGLEKYEAAFRDNEIDEKVLPKLTAEDLKDMGIGLVGHRRGGRGNRGIKTSPDPSHPVGSGCDPDRALR